MSISESSNSKEMDDTFELFARMRIGESFDVYELARISEKYDSDLLYHKLISRILPQELVPEYRNAILSLEKSQEWKEKVLSYLN